MFIFISDHIINVYLFKFAVYLDYSDAMAIFESFDIFYAKPLFTGKVSEALNYPIGFDSTIPKVLGLPDLPKGIK